MGSYRDGLGLPGHRRVKSRGDLVFCPQSRVPMPPSLWNEHQACSAS